jgi:nitrogen fixation/metabolism regulation signal transduction histidine kinase
MVLPLMGGGAWDSVVASGQRAIAGARSRPGSSQTKRALTEHEQRLDEALTRSRQTTTIVRNAGPAIIVAIVLLMLALALLAANIAGHLSRALTRPLQEIVEWTELIGRGEALPEGPPRKGAPEFQLLRHRMHRMAAELRLGRKRAVEAERAAALRESARQVAHEIKNPLTPIRLAVARLKRHATPEIAEAVEASVNTVYSRLRAARALFDRAFARRRAREEGGR